MQYAPSWIQMASTAGTLLKSDGTPTAETKATATTRAASAAANVAAAARNTNYAEASGYSDLLEEENLDASGGALPSAIDARASNTDSARSSSTTGDVFEEGGPFSSNAGTGRVTGASAASGVGSNTYGSSGSVTRLDPYDFWPGTRGSAPPAPAGTKQPVNGPTFGGTGVSIMGGSGATARSEPALYGPGSGNAYNGSGSGSGSRNSWDISMLPSFGSTGSDPSNQYAATSRVPGDQDFFPPTFAQSSSYSLANGSMKTNPVPVLADFSAFQN
jgi:hypothetical protein